MQISNAEWRIMKIIWMEGKQTSTDLIAVLSERFDWSKSTIKTLLTRLVEKGCLTREKSGKAFVYSPLLTQDQSLDLVVEDVKDKVCSKRIVQVLENLIEESDFTLADLNHLQLVLEGKKAEAVETVRCNCM
ncbi:CopY/TcrY family copper transport repressor [Streptococcus sp. W151]